jgi:hypothetical protein
MRSSEAERSGQECSPRLVTEFNVWVKCKMSKVQKIIISEPLGTMTGEGYVIDIDELRLLLDMPDAGRQALEDALRQRLARSGSGDVILKIITHDGGS